MSTQSVEERAVEILKKLLDQAGIMDRNQGYNDFDEVYDEGIEVIKEYKNKVLNPGTYGDAIEAKKKEMISHFHMFGRSTSAILSKDPDGAVTSGVKMDMFVLEKALEEFELWLDAEAD